MNGAAWDYSGNIKTPIYFAEPEIIYFAEPIIVNFAEPIMYNSVRVLGRVRGSVAVRRVLPNAVAASAR